MKATIETMILEGSNGKKYIRVIIKGVEINSELELKLRELGYDQIYPMQFACDMFSQSEVVAKRDTLKSYFQN